MKIGDIVKYYGSIGIITDVVDAVRFPNNTTCQEVYVLFASGHRQAFDTDEPRLEVVCE